MRLMDTGDEVAGPINIGNPNEFTIRQLAEKIIQMVGSKSEIRVLPLPDRRSEAAPARHHQGEGHSRMGAENRATRWARQDDRLFLEIELSRSTSARRPIIHVRHQRHLRL